MVKNDKWIKKMSEERGMLEPFESGQVSGGVVSYGISSYGYDMRISNIFKAPVFGKDSYIDPKSGGGIEYEEIITDVLELKPNSFVLARSLEYFRIPRDVLAIVTGKSTYARCGVLVNVTPLEPEWEGYVTICIVNTSPLPVRLYADEGIGQVVFIGADEVCETSYADKKGKYQAQKSIQTGIVQGDRE